METLARRSALVLSLLFGLLFAVGTAVMWYLNLSIWLAVGFAVGVVLLQYAVAPWIIDRLFTINWSKPEDISPEFAAWYLRTCTDLKIKPPRWGIIQDGNPNAFTYGHTRGDSRVVVTSGLVEILTDDELKAVVAHEFGHVTHRDFIVMTVAQSIPLILYIVYVWTRERARDGAYAIVIAAGAYLAYIASNFIVLFLSRVREYFADSRSAHTTSNPNALASALVKISYGLAQRHDRVLVAQALEEAKEKKNKKDKNNKSQTKAPPSWNTGVSALGICNLNAAPGWAMSASDTTGTFSLTAMNRAAQWEFKNPWAKWFEWNSTHPLTALRIRSLNGIANTMGQTVELPVVEDERRYSGNLASEIALYFVPVVGFFGGLWGGAHLTGDLVYSLAWAFILGSVGTLLYLARAYPRAAGPLRTVESLVGDEINVSHISAVPCVLEGEIIGRGVPGLFWSDDLVLRDGTGHMQVQYRQPFRILEFLWGWLKAARYQGRLVRVHGWYRRAPIPYVEISRVEMLDGAGGDVRCYYVWGTVALCMLGIVAGAVMLLMF
jgi:heat shock protein HtpX